MAYTIPSDTHAVNDTGHTTDHNNIVDVLKGMGAVYNVQNTAYAGGADPTGVSDSYAAIQAAINAAPAGSTILFPAGTYLVGTTLSLAGNLFYVGSETDESIIRMKTAANLAAVAATPGWSANTATSATGPVHLRYLTFDGNSGNQTSGTGHGIVSMSYYSNYLFCNFINTRGDGLQLTSVCANGSTEISNNAVENNIHRCQFRSNTGNGLRISDPAQNKITDGWVTDSIFDTSGQNGILIDSAAGWKIEGNHTYGSAFSAIALGRMFMTRVAQNYVETCGSSAASGFYYCIDAVNTGVADGGFGSAITGNTLYLDAPGNAGSTTALIGVEAVSGNSGNVAIDGNMLYGTTGAQTGISLSCQDGTAALHASIGGNVITGCSTPVSLAAAGGTLTVSGNYGGTDTSGTATASSPSFTSGTAKQLNTSQDVMLYIAVQTSAALAVAIGPANTTTTSLMPSQSYALGLISIRVPKSWWVKITGTIADLTITQVTC